MSLFLLACTADPSTEDAATLAECTATVADDVPAFFATYFACTDISMEGDNVVLATDSLPPYATYYYGADHEMYAEWDDQGGETSPNPSTIEALTVRVVVPADPVARGLDITAARVDHQMGTSDEEYVAGSVGVAPDSVANFNATAAPGDDIFEEELTFDEWDAHPTPNGEYHHHGANRGALAALDFLGVDATVFGVMCDGTVLLGCDELDGSAVDIDTLDAQDGHVGDIVDLDGTVHFSGRYHAHVCAHYNGFGLYPEIQYYDDCDSAPAVP
ncbi:MAG: YHYH protein [Deltaproteobacteria bacterium]|nr:YHYH protein [Deltaproteobacteria bacterium]